MFPAVTVLWLNYNSMHIIDITKSSLDATTHLDYPNLEVILVDNNSTDGSGQWVESYLTQTPEAKHKIRFYKLDKNLGFAGAINYGYKKRKSNAKYLAVTHNDVTPKKDYIKKFVTYLEDHPKVGAVQGIVAKLGDEMIIDSAGFMMDEGLFVSSEYLGKDVATVKKPMYVSMVEGTLPFYNLENVKKALPGTDAIYVSDGFMYYLEDAFVSLKLWTTGSACVVLPMVLGTHYRMGTSSKAAQKKDLFYYLLRNRTALLYMTNSSGIVAFTTQNLRKLIVSNRTSEERKAILVAFMHGITLGLRLRWRFGGVDFYKAPFVRSPVKQRLQKWLH